MKYNKKKKKKMAAWRIREELYSVKRDIYIK